MSALEDRIRLAPKRTFIVVGIIAAVGSWYSQTSPDEMYSGQIAAVQKQVTDMEKKISETEERFNNKKKFQDDMEQVSQTFRLALDYLPKELDTQDLLKKITIEARTAGVDLNKFSPKAEGVPKDFYEELPIDIMVKGSYGQMLTFLVSVSKLPRIITVRNVEISQPQFLDGQPVMQMSGTLVAYRYKEPK